jgi:hypothetical protein
MIDHEPTPATIAELKAACQGATADFIISQLEAEATVDQAIGNWIKSLGEQVQTLAEENTRLKQELESRPPASYPFRKKL